MRCIISILIISFLFLSCQIKDSDKNKNDEIKIKDSTGQILKDEDTISEIINDDFIARVLKNDLLLSRFTKIYRPKEIHEELIPNRHYPEKNDTILSFRSGHDFVKFHKAIGNILPVTITIMSHKVVLDKDIKIGAEKNILRNKLRSQNLSDSLVVRDLESGNSITFLFKNNRLIKIQYQAEYID